MLRNALLWASTNPFMAERLPQYRFVQAATRRFMPGETLEQALAYIADDESLEVTPKSLRLRKSELDPHKRKRQQKALKHAG